MIDSLMTIDQATLVAAAEGIIASHLWHAIAVFILVYLMGSAIKRFAVILNDYVKMTTDDFGIGATVYHNNEKHVIRRIGFRKIELYNMQSGERKYVKSSEWKNFELLLPEIPSKPKKV